MQKKRRGICASWSVLLHCIHPVKLGSDKYNNKDKRDALGGIIIAERYYIKVARREQFYIFMKHKDFRDHALHCVQMWVRFIREGSDSHLFEDIEDKD